MLNFVLCDDEANMLNKISLLFEKVFVKDDIDAKIVLKTSDISGNTRKFIKIDNKGTFVDLNEIQFIEKNGMKLIYHTDNELLEVYNSFSKIENSLPSNFVRCHKSFIANINNISSISLADSTILFKNNETCYIGPKYKNSFMEVIDYDTSLK